MVAEEIDHAVIQILDHLRDLPVLGFEIFEPEPDGLGQSQLRTADGVIVQHLEMKKRFFAFAQRQLAQVPFELATENQPPDVILLEANFFFAFAYLGDQVDFADAKIVARAVFER